VLPDYAVAEELAAGSLVAVEVRDPLPPIALRLTARDTVVAGSPLESLTAIIRDALGRQSGVGHGEGVARHLPSRSASGNLSE
jgi:hypothetical protein